MSPTVKDTIPPHFDLIFSIKGKRRGTAETNAILIPFPAIMMMFPCPVGDRATETNSITKAKTKSRPTVFSLFLLSFILSSGSTISLTMTDEAVNNWESTVDMPAANAPTTKKGRPYVKYCDINVGINKSTSSNPGINPILIKPIIQAGNVIKRPDNTELNNIAFDSSSDDFAIYVRCHKWGSTIKPSDHINMDVKGTPILA